MKTVMRTTKTAELTGGTSSLYHEVGTSYKIGGGKTCKLSGQILTYSPSGKKHPRSTRHNEVQGEPKEAEVLPWYKTANPWA